LQRQPLIIGHRGSSANAPENTLAAFRRAIAEGADGIEFDVRLARDGIPVVIHDATLTRTAPEVNPRKRRPRVEDLTSAELQQVDVSSWFFRRSKNQHSEEKPESVPTLEQVMQLFSGVDGLLYLEMKGEPVGNELLAAVGQLIRYHSLESQVIVECFDLSALKKLREMSPDLRTAALFERRIPQPPGRALLQKLLAATLAAGAAEIALHHRLANRLMINEAIAANLGVVVWTVDSPDWIFRAQQLGVRALITNNPPVLLAGRDGERG
jgi:glycerophosphoryl diester phosphodiesterase